MKRVLGLGIVAAMLVSAPAASAATEVGNECAGDSSSADYSVLQLAKAPGGALPLTVPRSGVVTRWRVNAAASLPATQILRLGVYRPAGGSGEYTTVAESPDEIVVPGAANSFEARIPVSVGDRFGTYGKAPFGPVVCMTGNDADEVGVLKSPTPAGSTNVFTPVAKYQVAVVATIEPDSDSDGFGDETQDRCPHNAALQALCPAVKLDITGLVKKSSVVLLVATSIDAPVSATATVKSYKLRAKPKLVPAGTLGKITLRFPKKLKGDLAALEQGKSLKLRVEASAADANGETDDDTVTVKLKAR